VVLMMVNPPTLALASISREAINCSRSRCPMPFSHQSSSGCSSDATVSLSPEPTALTTRNATWRLASVLSVIVIGLQSGCVILPRYNEGTGHTRGQLTDSHFYRLPDFIGSSHTDKTSVRKSWTDKE